MDGVVFIVSAVFVLIWAFRLETGIAKANEALKRIEERLNSEKKEK